MKLISLNRVSGLSLPLASIQEWLTLADMFGLAQATNKDLCPLAKLLLKFKQRHACI